MEDGNYLPIEPAFFDQRGYSNNFVIGMDEDKFVTYWQARLRKNEAMYQNYLILNSVPEEDQHMNPLAFAPYLPILAEKNSQLNNVVTDHLIKMIVDGVTDVSITDLQKSWSAAGGVEVTKEVTDWYNNQ